VTAAALGALIVDDEPLARHAIRLSLDRDREVRVVAECGSGSDALEVIAREDIALLFLDVHMPGLDGLEALSRLAAPPATVLVTAFADHAVTAFDLDVVDYVLKPFDDHRFARAVERAKHRARTRQRDDPAAPPGRRPRGSEPPYGEPAPAAVPGIERLVIRNGARIATLAIDDIDWIEAQDYCAAVHVQGAVHVIRQSLTTLEAELDPARFVRIHRNAMINVARIRELHHAASELVVVLETGVHLPVSRRRREALERLLGSPG
jgi:two-component system, LytTR family, response regulator